MLIYVKNNEKTVHIKLKRIKWEALHNPNFKRIEFDTFKQDASSNAYVFSIKKWNEELGAISLCADA